VLGALLSSLQTSLGQLFSKAFVLGSFLPMLLFLGVSLWFATALGGAAQSWAAAVSPLLAVSTTSAVGATWRITLWLLAVVGLSLIWSGLNGFLLELLEGKHLGVLSRVLYAAQLHQATEIDRKIQEYRRTLRELEYEGPAAASPAVHSKLKSRLTDARSVGMTNVNTAYPAHPWEWLWSIASGKHAARELTRVRWRRVTGQVNTLQTLAPAVDGLERELKVGRSTPLEFDHVELLTAIDDARERLRFEVQRLVNLRQFTYPTVSNANRGETALTVLAPTRLGNLTRTIRSYALDRYGMDLEIFWTRLQRVLQKDTAFYSTLSDAKSQVDLLVSLFCLTVLFSVFSSIYSLFVQPAPRAFLIAATLGPISARLLYLAACQNYLVFADLMRSSVDQFRFDLLAALHGQKPPGNREEILLWRLLGGWMGYGNDADVTYKDPV